MNWHFVVLLIFSFLQFSDTIIIIGKFLITIFSFPIVFFNLEKPPSIILNWIFPKLLFRSIFILIIFNQSDSGRWVLFCLIFHLFKYFYFRNDFFLTNFLYLIARTSITIMNTTIINTKLCFSGRSTLPKLDLKSHFDWSGSPVTHTGCRG